MPPRAYWKGFLRLSLVSCPIALYPATSDRDKVKFHQINKRTGNRIQYRRVDSETGREVDKDDIIKGYEASKGRYVTVESAELEAVALDSQRMIEIDEFVPRSEIDELYFANPYYIVPDGEVGAQAFAVIRKAIEQENVVALGRVVFTSREHVIALKPRGARGLLGETLRYPYEIRDESDFFDDMPSEKVTKDMLDLATHIVKTKRGHFNPEKFDDRYEDALRELLRKKRHGQTIEIPQREPAKVINLLDALRRSVKGAEAGDGGERQRRGHHRKATAKNARHQARRRKAG